jgi:hypothetical protein
VWRTEKPGDAYSSMINDQGTHTVWVTNGITPGKGFDVTVRTGCMAVREAERFLASLEDEAEHVTF